MYKKSPFLKFSVLCSVIFLGIFLWNKSHDIIDQYQTVTYQKKDKSIVSHKTTKDEIEKYKLQVIKDKRVPAATEKKTPITPELPWKHKLASSLLRFQNSKTKLFIQNLYTGKKLKENRELVVISFRGPRGSTSYSAEIDSRDGKIIATWGRTIHESPLNKTSFRL